MSMRLLRDCSGNNLEPPFVSPLDHPRREQVGASKEKRTAAGLLADDIVGFPLAKASRYGLRRITLSAVAILLGQLSWRF